MTRPNALWTVLALPVLMAAWGCDAVTGGLASNSDLVARAAGHELTSGQAATLLSGQAQLPNEPEVVEALADLWIDYTLLAVAAAEDSTLEKIDLMPVVRQQIDQELVFRLRDTQLQFDTVIAEDELLELYMAELPGARVRARHILLPFPPDATPDQRDSVTTFASQLRQRAVAGEDFGALAREFSSDRGSAESDGDLGFFGRGDMVRPFEEAAFALEPGELSEPVESPYGVHVIRLEERDVPDFEENREGFLARMRGQRVFQAESIYIAELEARASVEIQEGAVDAVKGLARRPQAELTRRSGNRALAAYEGGAYTAFEFQEYIQGRPPAFRTQVAQASDEQLEAMLDNLTRGELLVAEARNVGIELLPEEQDSLLQEARSRFVASAGQLGLRGIQPDSGETQSEAIDRIVMGSLEGMLQGTRDVIPLGAIAYSLRRAFDGATYDHNVAEVVRQIEALRGAQQSQTPPISPLPRQPAPTAADTVP